ncbi:hypothetical protein L3Q82_015971, partial [Scortum barcoo]
NINEILILFLFIVCSHLSIEEQQGQSEGAESSVRPSLSQVKKSWGFRRTTIARREFLDEVGDLTHSPPHVRRGRNRRTNQTPQPTLETCATQGAARTTKSVIDDLEWSAPSSPVSEESKPASETSAGGSLDPSLWQDFGSAFHTAFSLLGGSEGLSMDMSDALAAPDMLQATGGIEASPAQAIDEPEVPENMEPADDMEISQPVASNSAVDDVVLISSQEEDSDNMTLIQIKDQLASKGKQAARGGKGGRGKARGRGRGRGKARGKGRGRGRGRGRAVELQSTIGDDDDSDDEVMLVNPAEPQLQEEEKLNDSPSPAEIETSPAHSDISLSPAQPSNSDCIIIDSDLDQITYATPGQYDDAPEEEEEEGEEKKDEEKKDDKNEAENSGILDTEGYNSNALYCICQQKHNERFMICCDSCQDWFHGNCVGISQTQGRQMERKGQEYICPRCTAKKQSQLQSEPEPEPELEPELSFPECLTLSPPGEEGEGREEEQALKSLAYLHEESLLLQSKVRLWFQETVVVVEEEEAAVTRPEPEPEAEMETVSSLPLCIGPRCSKQALPDSVYCGTECILQHAAVTMKTLSGPKVPKSKGRTQRKAATARLTTKGQRSGRMSKRLAGKAEEEGEEEEMKEDDGGQKEASSPLACDPRLTEVQATSIPSSQFYTASKEDSKQAEAGSEAVTPSKQSPEDTSADAAPSVQPITEPERSQSLSQEKTKKPVDSGVSKQQSVESEPSVPLNQAKCSLSPTAQSPSTSAPRHHETGALMVTKTSYVIPKKQSGPQTQSSKVSVAASSQKPSSAPSLLNETRNLPVPPAPSAPSSRPSQPNNQVRQSIQRSLTSILFKRVCDCEDLKMSEIEVTKLVVSIEMEMFDIFRNTDSKYMNKYRTIMFNLKDPKNKGLLYRVIGGEISPFRLARMSQKDMQAIKASEPSPKETTEVKDAADKVNLLQKPEAVKVDLPSLNPVRRDRNMEQKKSLPASTVKTRTSQPSQGGAVPDVLACMLKDTTSEHKAHLFDLKCKICTGQILAGDEEPAKKKPKVSETREKYEPSWRKPAGDDSPLRAPPDSPDMDSPTSRLIIDSPVLTIVESPASPTTDSPASPTLESPASPVMQSPASPIPDAPKSSVSKRAYTPVVIPAVSTVSITRRDPRTAASRFSASSTSTSGPSNTTHNQSAPYALLKETRSASPPAPTSTLPTKSLPKSILMKPSSSADPRLYGTSSRTVISESPADGETAQFIAKQDILWKGFLNMLSVAKFVTKGYLVSGSAENLKADLPDTIQIGGRIMPETVWDYVAKLKTSVTKASSRYSICFFELCVIRFHPATEEEEVAYVSLFSYFSSRGRFGVVANSSRSIKDVYLVPLSAKEPVPSILQPLEGPGLEKNRPNLLLGLAIIQKAKRPGNLPLEIEEKRPKVHMAKDPMWIPKPPVLYGSDKLEIFQPYDPETPASTTPPGSPSCPGSPSESSSSGSVTVPSLLTSIRADSPVSTSASVPVNQSTSISISDKNPTTASSDKTPLQTILKTLFSNKQTDSADGSTTATTGSDKKLPVFSQVSGSMVDPIVQQYGQKSKVKEIEEEENDFDRPYDPEEEYDPAVGYGMVASQSMEKNKADGNVISGFVDDDVAYDPEDESIFEDIQSDIVTKPRVPTQTSDSPSCPTPSTTQAVTPAPSSTPVQTSTSAEVTQAIPTGTVVVSAATLTEQQRMLEELNKQIEEQKRQLKEQEEALRQQREAVGEDQQAQNSGDHGLKGEILVWVVLGLTGKDLVQISVSQGLKEEVYPWKVLGLPGEDLEVQMSEDQDVKGEVLQWRALGLTGEDLEVQISEDQDLKVEVLLWRALGLTGEDLEVQISEDQDLKGEVQLWGGLGLTEGEQEVQILGDKDLKAEAYLWRVLGLTGGDLGVQISEDQGLRGEVLQWRALELTGEDLEVQISEAQDLNGDIHLWMLQDLTEGDQEVQISVCQGLIEENQGSDRRGPGDQNTGGFGPDSRAPYTRGPGPDFIGVGPERTGPGMDYSGPHDRGQGGPHFRGPGPRSGHPDMEGAWPGKGAPEIRPRPERPGSCMEGPGPNRGPGGPNMRRPGPQHSSQNIEGPGLDRRGPEGPNFRGPGPERRPPDMDETGNSRSFPGGPHFSGPELERRPPDMEHPGSDRRGPHLRGMRPERTVIEGPGSDRKGLRGPDFRGSVFEGRGPQIEGPGLDRQEPGGLRFREPVPERRGPDMEGPQSDWRRSGGPDFRGPGIRQKGPNTEVPRNRGDDWGGADFGGLGPIQERPDIEGPGPDRSGQKMRGLGPMRRNVSGPGPNMNQGEEWKGPDLRGSEHVRRDTEEQWSDGGGPYMEPMSSFSSSFKPLHASPPPSFREHACDSVGVIFSQGGCFTHDPGQMLGTDLGLMEMSEVEYTHLQHLIQAHVEAQAASPDGLDVRPHPAAVMDKDPTGSTVISPLASSQAIDLSTSTEEHCLVMPGEKTPVSYGEVPGFVLARVRGEDSPAEPHADGSTSSQKRARSAARVCLEKRFNTMSADAPRQQDIQYAVLSNFLTMLQQSVEAQEAVIHPQMQKWLKTDRGNPYEVSSQFLGGVFNPVTNMCEQVIGHIPHMIEPNKHQGLIIPKSYSLNFRPERFITKGHYTSGSKSTGEQQLVNAENDAATLAASKKHDSSCSSRPVKAAKADPDSADKSESGTRKRARPHMSLSQRKERHNSKERERRKRIRSCCDELNMLVPFCDSDTDKVTTLQWTTAFLRYINKTYGDTFKEEFQKAFTDEKGLFPKSSPSLGHRGMDKPLSIPLAVEQ